MIEFFQSRVGEFAALSTAILWAFTATFFTIAGRNIGARMVNLIRLLLATLFLVITHKIFFSTFIPDLSNTKAWFYLGLSGAIGLTLGDTLLFQSFLDIGTQKGMVIMSFWPVFSSFFAYILLDEKLGIVEIFGVLLTILGISIVVNSKVEKIYGGKPLRGVLLAFGSALCQAVGILLAKEGLNTGMGALSGTVIRMIFAAIFMVIFMAVLNIFSEKSHYSVNFKGFLFAFFGSIVGPYLGVFLSLYAVSKAKVGIASALMTISPVLLIPLSYYFLEDKVKKSVVFGTLVTVIGSVLLFIAKR